MNDNNTSVSVRSIVNAQAEDDGLWFVADTAAEAYLQQALRRLHEAVERQTEFAWVIERYIGSILHYWTGAPHAPWKDSHGQARRFARRADAECMLEWHCEGIGRVAEHAWCAL